MESLFFKQEKALTVKILGIALLILSFINLITNANKLNQTTTMLLIGLLLLLSYSISYEIKKDYENKKHIKVFGFSIIKLNLEIIFPHYITIFSAQYKQETNWGFVAALGNEAKKGTFVIRLFKGNKHFTIYKKNELEVVKTKAYELSEFLNINLKN